MIKIFPELWQKYDRRLDAGNVPPDQRTNYRKWLRYYLDFCRKYGHAYAAPESLASFLDKLASKRQSDARRAQATEAVRVYHRMLTEKTAQDPGKGRQQANRRPTERDREISAEAACGGRAGTSSRGVLAREVPGDGRSDPDAELLAQNPANLLALGAEVSSLHTEQVPGNP